MLILRMTMVALAALTVASCMGTPTAARLDPPTALPDRVLPAQNKTPETSQSADEVRLVPVPSEEISARTPSPHRAR